MSEPTAEEKIDELIDEVADMAAQLSLLSCKLDELLEQKGNY